MTILIFSDVIDVNLSGDVPVFLLGFGMSCQVDIASK